MTMTPARKLRYALEAIGLWLVMTILGLLPVQTASNFGGWVGRILGPRFGVNKKGFQNLRLAFPEKSHEEHAAILLGMWDNLGRTMAEYPHLKKLSEQNTAHINTEYLEQAIQDPNGAIFIGGHIANWEVGTCSLYTQRDLVIIPTYRAPNNPWSDKMLLKARTLGGQYHAHAKSAEGGRGMMKDLRAGNMIGILVDQKYNEGIEVPFFGHPAMTNPVFVQLAQKFKCTLIPATCKRLDGANFEIILRPPITVFDDDGTPRPVEDVLADVHALLESIIREQPENWLWIHKRWKDDVYG